MPPTCTALLNNFVFSTKWLLFSSQIIFLMDPCLCPRDLNPVCPPDSVDISILLMWPKLTELLRFSFCCGQTDGPTSAWYIILLYLFCFKVNKNRGMNSGIEVVIMLILGQGCFHPIGCSRDEGHSKGDPVQHPVTLHKPGTEYKDEEAKPSAVEPELGYYYHCLYLCLYSPIC